MVVVADHLLETRRAFDSVASTYAAATDANPVLRAMRARALAELMRNVPTGGSLLDLGCGPGMDAAVLAREGYRVTAIDWSAGMVEEARRRLRHAGLEGSVQVLDLGIHELDRLPAGSFDAAYSSLGALNCVPDLGAAARAIAARLRPGGVLVASVMGRVCPWELVLFGIRGNWRRARLRFAATFVPVPFNGRTVWTRYYAPKAFAATLAAAGFTQASLRALGLLAPPPYLQAFAERHARLVSRLLSLEDRLARWPWLRQWGDHFLIVMRKGD